MAVKTFEVKNYQIKLGYELSGGGGGPKSRGYVMCFGEDGHRFVIYFAAPGLPMAAPGYFPETKLGSICLPVNEMPHYVDLVRNEKPIYAYLNSDNPQWNNLSTTDEVVGEEEL